MRIGATLRESGLIALIVALSGAEVALAQDVSFQVRTKDGRSEYRIEEPIALQLVFISSSKQYIVDTSFRYPEFQGQRDEFLVSPAEGSSDPMEDYRRALSKGSSHSDCFDCFGGLRGLARLGDKAVTLDLFLTRYVRFSKPGRYVLSIRSRRVSLARTWNEPPQVLELTSKPLNLTIVVADEGWQQEQLRSALLALKKGGGGDVDACETLMSLGTPAAELAMADDLESRDDTPGGCGFLFVLGVRNRKLVLTHMEERLESPLARISPLFVETMATLMTLEEGGGTDFLQSQREARKHITDELFALLDEKKGPARFAAVSTLVNESLLNSGNDDSGHGPQVLRLAAEVFDQLSSRAQSTLLSARWKEVASPAMASVLRRCAEADTTVSCGRLQGELLLARLNELSPADAREVILGDIQKENPRFPARVLAILADKELPEMDTMLLEHLQSKNGNVDAAAELIQRYATGAISGAVESYLHEKGLEQLGGQVESNLLAYLLRVQPDVGAQKLRAALAVRNGAGWYKYLLSDVAQRTPSEKIQAVAIDALSDPDQEVVRSAVWALARVGDEKAKMALFQRLAEWHAKWIGQERDMSWIPGDDPITDDRYLGDELIHSVATGAGWLLTEEDERRLLQSAVTENQKQQARQLVDTARNTPIAITIIDSGSPSVQINIAQYHYESVEPAKRKLSQFPPGTRFVLQSVPPDNAETGSATAEIQTLLTQRKMRLEIHKAQ